MKNAGGSAFPQRHLEKPQADVRPEGEFFFASYMKQGGGMSLRDWFAGQAINAIIIAYKGYLVDVASAMNTRQEEMVAELAYLYADAMLKEREKE